MLVYQPHKQLQSSLSRHHPTLLCPTVRMPTVKVCAYLHMTWLMARWQRLPSQHVSIAMCSRWYAGLPSCGQGSSTGSCIMRQNMHGLQHKNHVNICLLDDVHSTGAELAWQCRAVAMKGCCYKRALWRRDIVMKGCCRKGCFCNEGRL